MLNLRTIDTKTIIIIISVLVVLSLLIYAFASSGSPDSIQPEVYCIGENVYRYQEAIEACQKYIGRLATEKEIRDAYKAGAHWCNLGWVQGIKAFYPMQTKVPGGKCGDKGVNGGRLPSQLKLGAVCCGIKPSKESAPDVLPWDTRSGRWNM